MAGQGGENGLLGKEGRAVGGVRVKADAAERELERLRDGKPLVPTLLKSSTFSGLFAQSPKVHLPGHDSVTLEHFRAERIAFDDDGQFLAADTYRWRGRLVRIEFDHYGRKIALQDVATGTTIHEYAERQKVFLQGHTDVYLDDFPIERIPGDELGVYAWRDRTVRVIVADGKIERIIDADDGSIVYIFTEEDLHGEHLDVDLFSIEYFKLDRPAAEARLARICDTESSKPLRSGAPVAPFGRVHVVWPNKGHKGREDIRHGGTVF